MLITIICASTAFITTFYMLVKSYPPDVLVLLTYIPFLAISFLSILICLLDYQPGILKH